MLRILWDLTKTVLIGTGAVVWIGAIRNYNEHNK